MSASEPLTEDQQRYLQGFVAGSDLARSARGLSTFATALQRGPSTPPPATPSPVGPDAPGYAAQNRVLAEGKKLTPEESAKREKHPLDVWEDLCDRAAKGEFPRGTDILATKYHGLFYVAPAQDSFMCRLRFPAGIVSAHQFRGVASIADSMGGKYTHVTTRSNLQIREVSASDGPSVLVALHELGIIPRGSGADNIRNVTATPTAGIDPVELIDTAPLAKRMHHYILHHREMYGLPRKFNIAFDGGGKVAALEGTNDVGFTAVSVGEGKAVPPGVYFRLALGGISGHKDFAQDAGVLLRPDQCVPVAAAVVRVFVENGDRTDRKKARMKYVLDRWGHEKYLEETEKLLPEKLVRFPLDKCEPRPPIDRLGHIGVHPQRQPGLSYVGVVLPVGKLTCDQMRGLAGISERYGSASLRLTVWQNLLIPDVPESRIDDVKHEVEAIGLSWRATQVRSGLVACTGNFGCRLANADTKTHAMSIADHMDARLELDTPINVHVTGCPNSCAQHYIGDIGLVGTKVPTADDDMVEGYHLVLGGGYGEDQSIAREFLRDVKAEDAPEVIEGLLRNYLASRSGPEETFGAFTRRHSTDELHALFTPVTAS